MTTEPFQAPPSRRGPDLAPVFLGAFLVLVGVGWLLDATGVRVPWRAVLPAALIAVGLAAAAGAWRGRQLGLILVGLGLTAVLTVAAATDWTLDVPLTAGAGNRTERPVAPTDLEEYRLAVGELTLDLHGLQVPDGTTTVRARVGAGQLRVELPAGVAVRVDGSSGLGQVQALDQAEGGLGSRVQARSADFDGTTRRLVLELRVGLGQVEVDR